MKNNKIIFFASGDFAVPTLKHLLENNYSIIGIVSSKDKVIFNDKRIVDLAEEYNIPYVIPNDLEDESFVNWLRQKNPDIFCVISYKKLPDVILSIPNTCAFNVHASLLPFLRGAAPINWAIRNGYKETGLTAFLLNDKIDCGNILSNEKVSIKETDDYKSLFQELSIKCCSFTRKVIDNIILHEKFYLNKSISQSVLPNTIGNILKAPKINQDYFKDWDYLNADEFIRLIRSVKPIDGIPMKMVILQETCGENFMTNEIIKKLRCKIYNAEKVNTNHDKTIMTDGKEYIFLRLNNGECVSIKEIQLEGKKRLDVKEFLRGFKYKNKPYSYYFDKIS